MKKELNLTDAQEMSKNYSYSFQIPSQSELDNIDKGSIVKICVDGERFWARVVGVEEEKITGFIDNDLINTDDHGLDYNDLIEFEKRHVYSVFADNCA